MHKRQGLFLDALLLRQQLSEFLLELQVAREEQEQEQEQRCVLVLLKLAPGQEMCANVVHRYYA